MPVVAADAAAAAAAAAEAAKDDVAVVVRLVPSLEAAIRAANACLGLVFAKPYMEDADQEDRLRVLLMVVEPAAEEEA